VSEPCHHVRHIRGDGLDLRRELVPLGEETIGVGEVTDVEHGVVVGQVLDQPIGGHLRPGLEAGELVAPVTLPLPNENASSFTHDGWMATPATKKKQFCTNFGPKNSYESHVTEDNNSLERVLARERCCTEGGGLAPYHGSVWQLMRNLVRIPEVQYGLQQEHLLRQKCRYIL
jgi:hypothetical protein